jgi:cytochrome c oxidase subunit 2
LFRNYVFSLDHKVIGLRYALKQDAIPGIEQHLWFTPTRTGEWEIACSQLCGLGHYRMRGFYTIQTQADFDAWLSRQPASQPNSDT